MSIKDLTKLIITREKKLISVLEDINSVLHTVTCLIDDKKITPEQIQNNINMLLDITSDTLNEYHCN